MNASQNVAVAKITAEKWKGGIYVVRTERLENDEIYEHQKSPFFRFTFDEIEKIRSEKNEKTQES